MKVGIIGNYGATNVGDDAILTSLLSCLNECELTVFSANPIKRDGVETKSLFPLGFRSFFKHGFKASKKALSQLDVVILGGGGLFQDDRLYACFLWAWQVFWISRFKKPFYIVAAGVGPLHTGWARRLTKWAYQKADYISVRDQSSADCLKKIGLKSKVHVSADPVFSFSNQIIDSASVQKKSVFISIRPWLNHDQSLIQTMADFLIRLKTLHQFEFTFVVMQSIKEADQKLISPLIEKVGGKFFIPRDFEHLLQTLQSAQFALGMRYHFMIAALIAQVPLIPISYSPKTTALFDSSPLKKYMLDVHDLSATRLEDAFSLLEANQLSVRQEQKTLVSKNFEQVQSEFIRFKEALLHFQDNF